MARMLGLLRLWTVALLWAGLGANAGAAQAADNATPLAEAYRRAERFLPWKLGQYVLNPDVAPHWIGDTDQFWYARQTKAGKEFVIVEAASGKRRSAFVHALLAQGLSAALGQTVDPQNLPFGVFQFVHEKGADSAIKVSIGPAYWRCSLSEPHCAAAGKVEGESGGVLSPDGKWAAFLKGPDLWVRSTTDQTERALTRDGEEHFDYGRFPGAAGLRRATQTRPVLLWSPDSRRLLTHRLDEREVLDLHQLQFAPPGAVRPVLHSYRFAMLGDAHKPSTKMVILDVATGARTDAKHPPLPVTYVGPIEEGRAWWSADSKTAYVVPREEGQQRTQLLAMDAASGATRVLIEERGKTYVEIGGTLGTNALRTLADGRIIWYSERDDWGHLYLYDRDGQLIRQLTSGPWKVMGVVRLDEQRGQVFFLAKGREAGEDPYQTHLYSVSLKGSDLRLLTPENANHDIRTPLPQIVRNLVPYAPGPDQASFAPSGRYFVDTYSRPDLPPASVLRSVDGRVIATLERADISSLEKGGFTMPEPFSVLAADGKTRLYGTIFRPSGFDPARKYPIIDMVYPGPQTIVTAKGFGGLTGQNPTQSLAEVGFIIITMDGRGTPFRSKSFHDASYGKLGEAGNLEDHIAGIRQLAARYPSFDLERVGVTGLSAGGYASARAILAYPDFFKVAVSLSGNHDQRGYLLSWGPTYQGPYESANYDEQINARLAGRLKGKLLLMHGDMDDAVHPFHTLQLVDALIKANKDFDYLLVPGGDHLLSNAAAYVERRRWGYFVRHLLGVEPPGDYKVSMAGR